MTEHFKHVQQSGALGHGGALPFLAVPTRAATARRKVVAGDDPFLSNVTEPCLDLLLLHQHAQPLHGLDAFQLLLRAMCASGRKVDRAGLVDGHISLQVDGVALAYGTDRLPDRRNGVFFRPAGPHRPCVSGRLGLFLYRHQTCLRLRVACDAEPDLLQEIVALVVQRHPPKAVVLRDSHIVMSVPELLAADLLALAALVPGKIVPRAVARYERPVVAGSDARVSVFEGRQAGQSPKSLDVFIADSLAAREQAQLRAALRLRRGTGRMSDPRMRLVAAMIFALSAVVWVWGQTGGMS